MVMIEKDMKNNESSISNGQENEITFVLRNKNKNRKAKVIQKQNDSNSSYTLTSTDIRGNNAITRSDSGVGVNANISANYKANTTTVPTNVVVPPDGGWGWVVVAASFCCNLVVDGIIYSFGMFLPVLVEKYGASKAKVSLIGSLLSGSYLVAGPFASALANRYGFRVVTMVGAVLASIAFFVSCFATNIEFLYLTYGVLGGIGFGLIFVPAVITIGFYFEKWRALATGIAVCGSGVGTFIMAPLSAWLIEQYSWNYAMIIQAGFILNCAVFGSLFRPLQQMSVEVPINETTEHNEAKKEKPKLPLLLKTKILQDLKGKSESCLSIYEDLGVTADYTGDFRPYFSSNNKYPTASQILQLDIITDNNEQSEESLNRCVNENENENENVENGLSKLVVLSNQELSTNPHQPTEMITSNITFFNKQKDIHERNKSVSPVLQKRNSVIPEMRILLNRKYSLQTNCKSQSFTVSSTTTLASNKQTFNQRHTDIGNRPLYRDDIFFSSNLKRLSQYTSQTSSLNYTMSVTRLPTYTDVLEEKRKKISLCPEAMRRALATMLDISLMKSVTFILLAVSGFLTSMGMYTPFMYIRDRAIKFEINESAAVWLISVLGIANTIGRVGFGLLSSIPNTNAVLINNISLTLCGVCTIFSGISQSTEYQFFYASIFGLTMACFSSLRTIIIVDLLGLEKLTNAFGILLLFQGIAAVIGPPLAGFFVDVTGSYDLSFCASGTLIILSAAICYPIDMINKWEKARKRTH